eukprot:363637-Chlamydomonas_euryale.AAC.8
MHVIIWLDSAWTSVECRLYQPLVGSDSGLRTWNSELGLQRQIKQRGMQSSQGNSPDGQTERAAAHHFLPAVNVLQGWFSVTPEVLAVQQAKTCATYVGGKFADRAALDAMAGVGGNTVALASYFSSVTAVELSPERCAMIKHNAAVYGEAVSQAVKVLCTDFFDLAWHSDASADAVFVSPPWGGPQYHYSDTYDLQSKSIGGTHSVSDLINAGMAVLARSQATRGPNSEGQAHEATASGVLALFLPRNTDLLQLAQMVPDACVWHAERNVLNGVLKGLTVYCPCGTCKS